MESYDLLVLGAILLAFVLIIVLFLKTPKNERTLEFALKQNRTDLEKKLQSYPSSAEAVIIKANKKEVFYNSVVSQDAIATKTRWSKLRGYFDMATPFIALIMMGYSHTAYMDIVNNEPTKTYQELFEKECVKPKD